MIARVVTPYYSGPRDNEPLSRCQSVPNEWLPHGLVPSTICLTNFVGLIFKYVSYECWLTLIQHTKKLLKNYINDTKIVENVGNCDALQLDVASRRFSRFGLEVRGLFESAFKINNSSRDISAISKHLSVAWPSLYCTCAEAAIFELPVRHFEFDRKWIITVARRSRPIVHQRIRFQHSLWQCAAALFMIEQIILQVA